MKKSIDRKKILAQMFLVMLKCFKKMHGEVCSNSLGLRYLICHMCRHQMGTTLIHYTSIFNESQCGSPPESFIQKYWLVSNLPIFQNYCFFKKRPKNQQILKNSKNFFAFVGQFYRAFQWYVVCFHTFSGCWYTEGNAWILRP